jgi:glutamyl-tRNA reductase
MISENLVRRQEQTTQAETMISEEVAEFVTWLRSRGTIPTVVALRQHFEAIRQAELTRLAPKLNGLSSEVLSQINEITQLLIQKLLLTPTERLKSATNEKMATQLTESVTQLFDLNDDPHDDTPDSVPVTANGSPSPSTSKTSLKS